MPPVGRPWLQKRNMIYDLYPKMFVLGQRVFPQRLSGPDPSNRCDLVHWSASNCYGTRNTDRIPVRKYSSQSFLVGNILELRYIKNVGENITKLFSIKY